MTADTLPPHWELCPPGQRVTLLASPLPTASTVNFILKSVWYLESQSQEIRAPNSYSLCSCWGTLKWWWKKLHRCSKERSNLFWCQMWWKPQWNGSSLLRLGKVCDIHWIENRFLLSFSVCVCVLRWPFVCSWFQRCLFLTVKLGKRWDVLSWILEYPAETWR